MCAVSHHQYRGAITALSETYFGECADALDDDLTDTTAPAPETPADGTGAFYLVTARDAAGHESTLGEATSAERSRVATCP